MKALESSVGRKMAMAITGNLLVVFLVAHAFGNFTIYTGGLNAYAASLHVYPPALWLFRAGFLAVFLTHAWFGSALSLENRAAKPQGYAVKVYRTSTVSSLSMIWTGLALGAFLVFHELHFTVQLIHPEAAARLHRDGVGRPDVFRMVVLGLRHAGTSAVYGLATFALAMHLFHGIQSSAQTLGINSPRTFPSLQRAGRLLALLLALALLTIPAGIVAGYVR